MIPPVDYLVNNKKIEEYLLVVPYKYYGIGGAFTNSIPWNNGYKCTGSSLNEFYKVNHGVQPVKPKKNGINHSNC